MAQHDYIISNQTFPNTRADINNLASAIATNNSGTSAPTTQYAGQFWIDTTTTTWTLYIHDGSDDIQFATIDTSANTVNFTDSALSVQTDPNPTLGGDLDLNSNDITGTGNINITGTATISGDLTVDTNTLYVDSANNRVGVGTGSPSEELHIYKNTTDSVDLKLENSEGSATLKANNDSLYIDSDIHVFRSEASSEYMRIDSSGNVLVGTTSPTATGITLDADNFIYAKRTSNISGFFDRNTSDGDIVAFKKDGTTVGSIGVGAGGQSVYFGQGDTNLLPLDSQDSILPRGTNGGSRDGAIQLGTSTNRFLNLYLSGSVYLGGTGSANALDDYETGTHTATITPTTSGSVTLSTNTLSYVKIGNIVHVQGYLFISSVSSPVGAFRISLPFTSADYSSASLSVNAVNSNNASDFWGIVDTANNYITVYMGDYNSVQADSAQQLKSNADMRIQVTYYV